MLSSAMFVVWKAAKEGSREAKNTLFSAHSEKALKYIRKKMGAKLRAMTDAEDILQDAYLSAHQNFDQFQYTDHGAYFRWLRSIIDGVVNNSVAKYSCDKRQPVPIPKSDPTPPSKAARRSEEKERIERAIASLPEREQQAVRLFFHEGLKCKDVAARMGVSEDVAWRLKNQGIERMGGVL